MENWSQYAVGGAASRPDSFTGLQPQFATGLGGMLQAAHAAGIPLQVTSAYRSPELQGQLYQAALAKYGSPEAARKWVAPPGRSQHNFGTAADFAVNGSLIRDANSPEAQWIKQNAANFGLAVPMDWEPWQVELAGAREQMSTRGGDTPTAVATDTRTALGFPQRNEGSSMMPPREKPQGLLQTLGIQKKGSGGPQGDVPFYQRDQFQDVMGRVAMGANTLRANPDQNIPAIVGQQRQRRDGNRTAEWLGQQEGGAEFAQMIASGADPAAVLMEYRNSRMPAPAQDPFSPIGKLQGDLVAGRISQAQYNQAAASIGADRGPLVSMTLPGQATPDPFTEKLAGAEADQFVGFLEQGPIALRNLSRLDQLEGLLENTETGFGAAAKLRLGEFGIETDGLSELQAASALINQLVPAQRPPGSGPMSDADLEMFKQSIVRIINTPEGNTLILQTMRQINEYDAELARIAQRAASGDITRAEARDAVNGMSNPLENFNERIKGVTRGGGATPPSGAGATWTFNPETGGFD